MKKPDWCLVGDRLLQEEVRWVLGGAQVKQAQWVRERKGTELGTVLDVGCGTGLFLQALDRFVPRPKLLVGLDRFVPRPKLLVGLDRSEEMLRLARQRLQTSAALLEGDLRDWVDKDGDVYDVVACFNVLKTFGLHEFDAVLERVLAHGRHAALSMQTLAEEIDNGTTFHHTYVTEAHLKSAIAGCGHEVLDVRVETEAEVEGHGHMKDLWLWTRRKGDHGGRTDARGTATGGAGVEALAPVAEEGKGPGAGEEAGQS